MYASVRRYTGIDPGAVDQVIQRRQEVEALMRGVPGFRAWYMLRADGGMITVTVRDDQAGAEQSVRAAVGYVKQNMPDLIPNPPEVANGEVVLQITG